MIIYLDSSIPAGLQDPEGNHDAILSALSICCQQVSEGTHILCATRTVFADILQHADRLGPKNFAILKRSSDKLTQRKLLMDNVCRSVLLVADRDRNTAEICRNVSDLGEQVVIPVEAVDKCSGIVAKPLLLVENITDGKFLLKLITDLAQLSDANTIHVFSKTTLRCEIAPGGGSTLAQLYALKKSERSRLGVAIVDSDRAAPTCAIGQTARALVEAHDKAPLNPLLEVLVLPVRASENLIPRSMVVALSETMDTVLGQKAAALVQRLGPTEHWPYVNVKGGLRCFELGLDSSESVYWTGVVGGKQCEPANICESKNKCQTFVLSPLSNNLLFSAAENSDPLVATPSCMVNVGAVWSQLAKLLFSLFCGAEPITGN